MNLDQAPKVFFAVLNMGLGHATRSLPLIREFIRRGWVVFVGSSGRSLTFLRQEVQAAHHIHLPDYGLVYSKKGLRLNKLLMKVPSVLRIISKEHEITDHVVRKNQINLVISDHRYGCYSIDIPSYFISHQLRFISPGMLRPFEFMGAIFNRHFHRKFTRVIVPDILENGHGLLSGRLSTFKHKHTPVFSGILSSISSTNASKNNIDLLVSISGPEPQRTALEQLTRDQITDAPGKKVVALGKPESEKIEQVRSDLIIYHHLNRNLMEELFNRSKLIIARSGYSTLMELAELSKKAMFIPTPGQTEQLYLANRFKEKGWFYSVLQNNLNLKRDIHFAMEYEGIPMHLQTSDTVNNLFNFFEKELKQNDL